MATRLSLLAVFLFSAGTAHAQRPEVRDARAVFSVRVGQTGPVSLMRDYVTIGQNRRRTRMALVEMNSALYVLFGQREGHGWRSQVRYLHDASTTITSNHDLFIAVVSEASRIFAVKFALTPPTPDSSPCACSAPGGTHRTRWFQLDGAGGLQRLLDFDPSRGSAIWDEQAKQVTLTQVRGVIRCPRGCDPAPSYQMITETIYRFVGARFDLISGQDSRRY